MRRGLVLGTAAVIFLTAGVAAPAAAYAPTPTPPASPLPAGAGTPVCTPTGRSIGEISGLVATNTGYLAIQDSQPAPAKPKIFELDDSCRLLTTLEYPFRALDPEDAAIDKDGTLYVADTGDNSESDTAPRATVAIWTLTKGAKTPVINRLSYPDDQKHDAEALLLNGDGTPIIITKTAPSEVYVPEGPLTPGTEKSTAQSTRLKKVGTFTAQDTKTQNPLDLLGWKLVTGAANSPDGTRVVIRTYSDAYEFDVTGGDVVKAITSGKPRITPLPNEPQGEAIAYTPDGKSYLTASDVETTKKQPALLKYAPTTATTQPAGNNGATAPTPKPAAKTFLQSLTLQDITYAVAAIGIVGLLLVIAGIIGIRRSRAGRRDTPKPEAAPTPAAPPAMAEAGAPDIHDGGQN